MPRHRLRRLPLAWLVLSSSGCTTWTRVPPAGPAPAGAVMQLWIGDWSVTLRDVVLDADSIRGRRLAPDTARVSVARRAVDSLRIAGADVGTPLILGAGAAILLLLAWAQDFSQD